MKKLLLPSFLFVLSFILGTSSYAQFQENFDNNDLTSNPTWNGNLDHFIVTSEQQLQLNAPSAGISELFTNSDFEPDYTWQAKISMNFSPSSSNRLEYFFMIDNWDETSWNGYSFEIGEDGSNDGLTIYRWENGVQIEIAKGMEGKLASAPAQLNIKIQRLNNTWSVFTNYDNSAFLTEEFDFIDNTHTFQSGYTGFRCHYTSTRKDKFFFDDLINVAYSPDTEGPLITEFSTLDNKTILIYFNELIDPNSIPNAQFDISPNGSIVSVKAINNPTNALQVEFEENLLSGPTYNLTVADIKDMNDNLMESQTIQFYISESPKPADLLISEILFDPISGGSDFIELYNHSDKILNLENLRIENSEKDVFKFIEKEITLMPHSYIALSPNIIFLKNQYNTPDSANLVIHDIPSMNISSGNVSIYNSNGIMLDSMNYLNEWHYELLESTKGVSLERISFDASSTSASNWFSGSTNTNYATPGYKNTNSTQATSSNPTDILSFDKNYFSPNQDGMEDLLIIRVNSEFQGTIGSIKIFDIHGVMVKDLANNILVSNQDQFFWDGLNDQGNRCKIGHYIVLYEGFNTVGKKVSLKKAVKLLDFI